MEIRIYVVTHKKFITPKSEMYVPIIAGADEYPAGTFTYLLDNTGDNISSKHWLYSEFTVIYWIWKNVNVEYVGENHYRRYFIGGAWKEYIKHQFCGCLSPDCAISKREIAEIMESGYDCIIPRKQAHLNRDMYHFYCDARSDGKKLFEFLESIISNKYPDYLNEYHVMLTQKNNYFKVISIMKKEKFDSMAEWLFGIFEELEKIQFEYKDREFAYLGEWLINVWIMHNERTGFIKPKELFYINTDCTIGQHTCRRYETIWPMWLMKIDHVLHIIWEKSQLASLLKSS